MYERRHQPLLPLSLFMGRLFRHALIAFLVVAVSLGIGIVCYHVTEHMPWIDALLNASMILGGMGPVTELHTPAGKVFASAYALFSGVVFLVTASILIAPIAHRFLHRFHLDGSLR